MILVADSGSSKTDWVVIGPTPTYFTGEGLNPYFVTSALISASVLKYFPGEIDKNSITAIYFYGAGCFEDKSIIVKKGLQAIFINAQIQVSLDILGAAISLLGNQAGFVSILGTGMNTCLFDGTKITKNIDSLGFVLGDEGSGSHLGKLILSDYIRGNMPVEVENRFREHFGIEKEEIFEQVYGQAKANAYCAGFAPFLNDVIGLENPYSQKLVKKSFNAFFENMVTKYTNYASYTFNSVGSIAFFFKDALIQTAAQYGMRTGTITKAPIFGLVSYYQRQAI